MKIRNGFVSNSSSSSFCIFGIYLDEEDMYKKWLEVGLTEEEWEEDKYDRDYTLANKLGVDYNCPISGYSEGVYLGIYPHYIPEDKTIREVKEELSIKLNVLPEDIDFYHDGGYDG